LGFIKIENFSASVETFKKVKRQPTEWRKIFANHIFYKELVSSIYKNFYNSITIKQITELESGQGFK